MPVDRIRIVYSQESKHLLSFLQEWILRQVEPVRIKYDMTSGYEDDDDEATLYARVEP